MIRMYVIEMKCVLMVSFISNTIKNFVNYTLIPHDIKSLNSIYLFAKLIINILSF